MKISQKSRLHFLAALCIVLNCELSSYAVVKTFHEGVDGYTGTNDTWIWDNLDGSEEPLGALIDRNFNGGGQLPVTRSPDANPNERAALVRFDNLGIPAGSTINSATLRLFKIKDFGYSDFGFEDPGVQIDVAGLLVPFGDEGIGQVDISLPEYAGVDGGPTANNRLRTDVQDENTYETWTLPLARSIGPNYASASFDTFFDRGPVESSVSGILSGDEGYIDFDITTSFFSQYANNKMYGWIVHGDVTDSIDTDGQVTFRDWEFENGAEAPQLVIDFTPVTPDGDFDFDGDVDGSDFLVWQRGAHSATDLQLWQSNYGTGPVSAVAVVPEPTTLALIIPSILIITQTYTRGRRKAPLVLVRKSNV